MWTARAQSGGGHDGNMGEDAVNTTCAAALFSYTQGCASDIPVFSTAHRLTIYGSTEAFYHDIPSIHTTNSSNRFY